jgi:hypothetical protein
MRKLALAALMVLATVIGVSGPAGAAWTPGESQPQAATAPGNKTAAAEVWSCNPRLTYRYCTTTNARVNVRTQPTTNSGIVTTVSTGTTAAVSCYRFGQPINGDSVWYWVSIDDINTSPASWPKGYIAGYYLNTGADPNPLFRQC